MESQYIQINFASEVVEKRIHHGFWLLCILLLIHKKVRPESIIYTITTIDSQPLTKTWDKAIMSWF